ncbi:hypothetical protein Bca4012_098192 [Brassica carinata]
MVLLQHRLQKKSPPIVVIRSSKKRKQRREEEGRNHNPNPQNHESIRGSGGDGSSRSDSVAESVVFGKEKDFNGGMNIELDGSESVVSLVPCRSSGLEPSSRWFPRLEGRRARVEAVA